MTAFLRRFRAAASDYGLHNLVVYGADRIVSRISKNRIRVIKYLFVAQPVPSKSLLPPGRGTGINIREISAGDPLVRQMPRPLRVLEERFRQGAHCIGAFIDESMIGFLWLKLGPYQEDEVRARFVPQPATQTAWDFDVYVDPQRRLGFALARLWDAANEYFRRRGVSWSMSRISAFNLQSMATHKRLGAVVVGSALFIRGRQWQATFSTLPPFAHVSRNAGTYPTIGVAAPKSTAR